MTLTLIPSIAYLPPDYATHNQQIDEQHQELFEIVNALHSAVVQQQDVEAIQVILDRLALHTIEHFQTEEKLMLMMDYPDYQRHKQSHDNLLGKMRGLLQKFGDRRIEMTTDITQFLTEWLAHHIKGEDQKMIEFFQNSISFSQ